ncbi:MAG: hypothetical protein QG671_1649 [Actinomycetota bacterium]|nr:hypothetical protein [Actinomycetota bacterium]
MGGDTPDADGAILVLLDAGEDDTDVYVLGLRQSVVDDESLSLLFLECDDAESQQKIDLGMDTYCLVVDPGQATAYGGVLECEVTGRRLRLALTDETADELGLPSRPEFALDLTEEQLAMVRRGLRRVLTSGRPDDVPAILGV